VNFVEIDLHYNRFTVAGMKLEPEKIVTKISTHTFEEQSYQQFLDSLKEDNYVLIESSTNVPCEFCLP